MMRVSVLLSSWLHVTMIVAFFQCVVMLWYPVPFLAVAQECAADGTTCDTHERCSVWKEEGECVKNEEYMIKYCPVSCSDFISNKRQRLQQRRQQREEAINSGGKIVPQDNSEDESHQQQPQQEQEQEQRTEKECKDFHLKCPVWKKLGECDVNDDMLKFCPKSCGTCGHNDTEVEDEENLCVDKHDQCAYWADIGECEENPLWMHKFCARSCGTCPIIEKQRKTTATTTTTDTDTTQVVEKTIMGPDDEQDEEFWTKERVLILDQSVAFGELQAAEGTEALNTINLITSTTEYMQSSQVKSLPKDIQDSCRNRQSLCSFWAVIGECEENPAYMRTHCAPACQSCHMIDINVRCPNLPDAVPGLRPGDLNKMFERIVATAPGNRTLTDEERKKLLEEDHLTEYSVIVHSRPSEEPATEISVVNDKSLPPWVITFENFVTPEECDAMIQLGYDEGYKRSEDVGAAKFDGTFDSKKSSGRTSENAWCSFKSGCRESEVASRLHKRISHVTGIPPENSEDFQLLRYELNQFYNTHHDYIPHQKDRQCGPRILTFFMYLSDVEEGGGTDFPGLGLTIMPKKGRALLWPSVLDSQPEEVDQRTRHQALPVKAGTKFAANGWIHLYDYVGPAERGCN